MGKRKGSILRKIYEMRNSKSLPKFNRKTIITLGQVTWASRKTGERKRRVKKKRRETSRDYRVQQKKRTLVAPKRDSE